MKKILITQRLANNESYFEQREMLDIAWGKLFKEVNLLPISLPYEYDFEKYFNEVEIDGVLLTGGNDLNSLNQNELSQKRDDFENKLIYYAIKNNIPVFGVCRGMQIITEYFGSNFKIVNGQVDTKHKLVVNGDSKYSDSLNSIEEVNSFHNYGIDNLSDEFIVSASCEKGLIKAIEHKKYKIFAQMWHSERVVPFNLNELNLIKVFFT